MQHYIRIYLKINFFFRGKPSFSDVIMYSIEFYDGHPYNILYKRKVINSTTGKI